MVESSGAQVIELSAYSSPPPSESRALSQVGFRVHEPLDKGPQMWGQVAGQVLCPRMIPLGMPLVLCKVKHTTSDICFLLWTINRSLAALGFAFTGTGYGQET